MLTNEQKEHLEMLCQALESGEYKQGQGRLRKGDTFCCLGVACDLYAKRVLFKVDEGWWEARSSHESSRFVLPNGRFANENLEDLDDVKNYFGFENKSGFDIDGFWLTEHNDGNPSFSTRGELPAKSFKEIAELIRKYVAEN